MASIRTVEATRDFGDNRAVDHVSLAVESGEVVPASSRWRAGPRPRSSASSLSWRSTPAITLCCGDSRMRGRRWCPAMSACV